jgi:hypothetical protein
VRAYSSIFAALLLIGCGSSVDITDDPQTTDDTGSTTTDGTADDSATPPDDTGSTDPDTGATPDDTASPPTDTGVMTDTGVVMDTTPPPDTPPPMGCAATALATDPASTLDPAAKGPLTTGTKTITVPKLGPLTDVKVKVTYPTNSDGTPHSGRHAWVMFHHAVHGPYPGVVYDDYPTIHGHWASHGFYVFSIDGSKIFFPTSSGSSLTWTQQNTVAGMMSEAITYFLTEQEKTTADFPCRLDPSRLAVAGHSRGGGATLLVPTTRTDSAKIKALLSFQGVDPGSLTGADPTKIPGFDLPAMWLDAALDGDVIFPINALQYGRTNNFGAMVTILGSKHTFTFDANATPHQGGTAPTVTPAEHKAVCVQYSTAFFRAKVRDESPNANDLDRIGGTSGLSSTVSSGGILLSFRPPRASTFIARFDDPTGAPLGKTEAGGTFAMTGSMTATPYETYGTTVASMGTGTRNVSKQVLSVLLKWDTTGGGFDVPLPTGAFTGKKWIAFDLAMPEQPLDSGTTPLELEVKDSTGATATVAIKDYLGSGWFKRPRRLSTAIVPTSKLTAVDLTKATSVRVVAKSGAAAGTAMIDSLRFE